MSQALSFSFPSLFDVFFPLFSSSRGKKDVSASVCASSAYNSCYVTVPMKSNQAGFVSACLPLHLIHTFIFLSVIIICSFFLFLPGNWLDASLQKKWVDQNRVDSFRSFLLCLLIFLPIRHQEVACFDITNMHLLPPDSVTFPFTFT